MQTGKQKAHGNRAVAKREMNRLFATIISLVCLTAVSCSTEKIPTDVEQGPVTVAFRADNAVTRTQINGDGHSTSWQKGDRIALWARNGAQEFTLANQTFSIFYRESGNTQAYFTSTLPQAMPEGRYTYYAAYPLPESVEGTQATFAIPGVQDGRVGGGADIMVAVPAEASQLGPLEADPDLSLTMRHKLHVLRFYIPEGYNTLGEPVERIVVTMPQNISGKATTDITDAGAAMTLAEGSNTVELQLATPIDASTADGYQYACAAIFPSEQYGPDDVMHVALYSEHYAASVDNILLAGRTFAAGHVTPVPLRPVLMQFQNKIRFTLGTNNLGEDVQTITLTAPEGVNWSEEGSNVLTIDAARIYDSGYFDLDFNTYASVQLYEALANQRVTVQFESENAIVTSEIVMPDTKAAGTSAGVTLDVPYLIFENFDSAPYFSNRGDDGNSEKSEKAEAITGLTLEGWTGNQVIVTNGRMRLKNRREYAASFLGLDSYGNYRGRANTPALGIKEGHSVKVQVEFTYGGSTENSVFPPLISFGYTDNAAALDGFYEVYVGGSQTSSGGSAIDNQLMTSEDPGTNYGWSTELKSAQFSIEGCNSQTRLSWEVNASGKKTNTYCNQWLYIDDIKVKIVK